MTALRKLVDVETITDPPVGATVITGDYSSFDQGPDAPDPPHPAVFESVRTGGGGGGGTSVSVANPPGDGSLLIAFISYDAQGDASEIITPSSPPTAPWFLYQHVVPTGADHAMDVYAKQSWPDDPSTFVFSWTGSRQVVAAIIRVKNGTFINTFQHANAANTTSHSTGTITNPNDIDSLLITAWAGSKASSWGSVTSGDGHSSSVIVNSSAASFASLFVAWRTIDRLAGFSGQTAPSGQSMPDVMAWVIESPEFSLTAGYSGWVKLVLTRPTAVKLDTFGSDMSDTRIAVFGNLTEPSLYENDDTSEEPYASNPAEQYWSSIDTILLPVGTYYIRVWPYDADGYDLSDGNAQLRITVFPTGGETFDFVDRISDVETLVDPPFGETYVTADFSGFTITGDEPTELTDDWQADHTGWVKLVLTETMFLGFDTYDSAMFDTVLAIYTGVPGPSSLMGLNNDDTPEPPFRDTGTRTYRQSAILFDDLTGAFKTIEFVAGTYYIALWPFLGSAWLDPPWSGIDPPEGSTALLRITRTPTSVPLAFPRGTIPPPVLFGDIPIPLSDVVIRIAGSDITHRILIAGAEFTAQVNGMVGLMSLSVLDLGHDAEFVGGEEVTLDINGVRHWGGWVNRATRAFPFSSEITDVPAITPRYWKLSGFDYNILFLRRFVLNPADPTGKIEFAYPVGTYDDTIINDIFDHYLTIAGDGLSRSGVQRVAIVALDIPGVTGKGTLANGIGTVASAGYSWKEVMDVIAKATGAVYYIDPNKVLCYVDVDTPSTTHRLSDVPTRATDGKYRGFELLKSGMAFINDMLVWGAGLGVSRMVFSRKQDTRSQSLYGRWQEGLYTVGLIHQASADLVASSYLDGTPQSKRGHKDPKVSLSLQTYFPYYPAGVKVTTRVNIFGFSDVLPVRKSRITFPVWRNPSFELVLGHEIDEPWSIFEQLPIGDFGQVDINVPLWQPVTPSDGILHGVVIDSFSREISDWPNAFGDWDRGEHTNWNIVAFFQNHHQYVTAGRGIVYAGQSKYIRDMSEEESEYPGGKPMGTLIDDVQGILDPNPGEPLSIVDMFIKFQIKKQNRLIPGRLISATATGEWASSWSGQASIFTYNEDAFGSPAPAFPSGGGIAGGVLSAPVTAQLLFEPDPAFPIDAINGTVIMGSGSDIPDPAGHGIELGNPGGFTHWTEGGSFAPAALGEFDWADGRSGLHFNGGFGLQKIFYTAVDERAPEDWMNALSFGFIGAGGSRVLFQRLEGGSGAVGITTQTEDGTSVSISDLALIMDPDVDYWCRWYRPNPHESYVKVWRADTGQPVDWQAIALASGSTTPTEPNHSLTMYIAAFPWQQYAISIDLIASQGVEIATEGVGGGGDLPAAYPPYFDGITYQLPFAFYAISSRVFVNGGRKRLTLDYTEQPSAGRIIFGTMVSPTDEVAIFVSANGLPV